MEIFTQGLIEFKNIIHKVINRQNFCIFQSFRPLLGLQVAPRRRFERLTCRLGGGCSVLLSYRGAVFAVFCIQMGFQIQFDCINFTLTGCTRMTVS